MTVSDTVRDHQARCAPHLARLWMLAGGPGGAPLRPCAVQQIVEATGAILAEVRSAGGGTFTVAAGRSSRGSVPLLAARLTRLENAAGEMIDSARRGDAGALRMQIARFDVLTAAIWTVHLSECAPSAIPRPTVRPWPFDAARADAGRARPWTQADVQAKVPQPRTALTRWQPSAGPSADGGPGESGQHPERRGAEQRAHHPAAQRDQPSRGQAEDGQLPQV
jgi:hypothetical protein